MLGVIKRNKLVVVFLASHILFAIFLGRLFALAPDEGGYLYTFNNLYGSEDANPQFQSGWITAPKPFLWLSYLPAKLLNVCGFPDYLSIRFLSIGLASISLVTLIGMQRRSSKSTSGLDKLIFLSFFIPSIFLWTSVGLRESFIVFAFTLLLAGFSRIFEGRPILGLAGLVVGSYCLMSVKNYLWVCFVLSLVVTSVFLVISRVSRKRILLVFTGVVVLPCILFASTTSAYAFEFFLSSVFHTDIAASATRSGDSIVQVAIQNGTYGTSSLAGNSGGTSGGTANSSRETVVTFHGDTTLILLHFYFVDHPYSVFTKVLTAIGIKGKLDSIWEAKVKQGLIKKSVAALPDSSSLSGYILKPASAHNPVSIFRPAFLFMFGPIPFLDQGGLALNTVSFESPMWWALYLVVFIALLRYGRKRIVRDPVLMTSGILFLALVAFSALVEVNLGTSFRHRSILLIPLLVMFIRARSKPDVLAH